MWFVDRIDSRCMCMLFVNTDALQDYLFVWRKILWLYFGGEKTKQNWICILYPSYIYIGQYISINLRFGLHI